jgi:hypothetical protein
MFVGICMIIGLLSSVTSLVFITKAVMKDLEALRLALIPVCAVLLSGVTLYGLFQHIMVEPLFPVLSAVFGVISFIYSLVAYRVTT